MKVDDRVVITLKGFMRFVPHVVIDRYGILSITGTVLSIEDNSCLVELDLSVDSNHVCMNIIDNKFVSIRGRIVNEISSIEVIQDEEWELHKNDLP